MTEPRQIPLRDARARLGLIIQEAQISGQSVVITRNGRPVAEIVPITGRSWSGAGAEVWHKDGDLTNNDPANLEIREYRDGRAAGP